MARTTGIGTGIGGVSPIAHASNALVWISAIIVMGILSYYLHVYGNLGTHVIYTEVIAVLTVAFFFVAWLINSWAEYSLLFNIIFSHLWLVAVVFLASDWSGDDAGDRKQHTAEAFTFIAFFGLVFNVLFHWHRSTNLGRNHTTTTV